MCLHDDKELLVTVFSRHHWLKVRNVLLPMRIQGNYIKGDVILPGEDYHVPNVCSKHQVMFTRISDGSPSFLKLTDFAINA